MNKTMEKELNKQVNAEFYSSYLYLSMAAYLESIDMKGAAGWMKEQAKEELDHAVKFFDYINDRGGRVILENISKPQSEWNSVLDVFESAYQHEKKVTSMINNLVDLASKDKDYATLNFLQWFVAEQVEEESSMLDIVKMIKMVRGSKNGMFMVDRELARRGED